VDEVNWKEIRTGNQLNLKMLLDFGSSLFLKVTTFLDASVDACSRLFIRSVAAIYQSRSTTSSYCKVSLRRHTTNSIVDLRRRNESASVTFVFAVKLAQGRAS